MFGVVDLNLTRTTCRVVSCHVELVEFGRVRFWTQQVTVTFTSRTHNAGDFCDGATAAADFLISLYTALWRVPRCIHNTRQRLYVRCVLATSAFPRTAGVRFSPRAKRSIETRTNWERTGDTVYEHGAWCRCCCGFRLSRELPPAVRTAICKLVRF